MSIAQVLWTVDTNMRNGESVFLFLTRMQKAKLEREQEKLKSKRDAEENQRHLELYQQEQRRREERNEKQKRDLMQAHLVEPQQHIQCFIMHGFNLWARSVFAGATRRYKSHERGRCKATGGRGGAEERVPGCKGQNYVST